MQKRFNLVRYFAASSSLILGLVGAAVLFMEHQQGNLLRQSQGEKYEAFRKVQGDFTNRAEEVAIRDMLRINENGHENLAKVMSNVLWEKDLGPYMAKVQSVTTPDCKDAPSPELKKSCVQTYGRALQSLPGFRSLDEKVYAVMRNSTVFKVKMYDLRGITLYSSEHAQMGEDKSDNVGWRQAATQGKPASELTHRDKFSGFESVVADRDLISSYLPMTIPGGSQLVGVFEIYSDVTPFLKQIKSTTDEFRKAANKNNESLNDQDSKASAELRKSGWIQVVLVVFLLIVLYALLLKVVLRAQARMDEQQRISDEHKRQQAKADKSSTMSQLIDGLVSQIKVPLSAINGNLQQIEKVLEREKPQNSDLRQALSEPLGASHEAAAQANELLNGLRAFGSQNQGVISEVDINALVASVVHVVRALTPHKIQIFENYQSLPRAECNTVQLSQAILNILLNAVQSIQHAGRIRVHTGVEQGEIRITVKDSGSGIVASLLPKIFEPYFSTKEAKADGVTGLGLSTARDILEQHRGRILVHSVVDKGSAFALCLPL